MASPLDPPVTPSANPRRSSFTRGIGWMIFGSRWLQAPLYLGLIVAQLVYVVQFGKELWHLVSELNHLDEAQTMLIVLGLVDVVMVANLLIMVIVGGLHRPHHDRAPARRGGVARARGLSDIATA
ncbi:MAG: YqhA family protein [Thermoleophilia bacterium]|nr:YqhA family protein [Thermoleophilia bacterium]